MIAENLAGDAWGLMLARICNFGSPMKPDIIMFIAKQKINLFFFLAKANLLNSRT
jgi:hypothetical protein